MSYLSAEQESLVNEAFSELHYNFAKRNPFYAVSEGSQTVVSHNINHNAFYGASPLNTEVVTTKQSGLFYARTSFVNGSENFYRINFGSNSEPLPEVSQTILKVITDSTGNSLLEDAERIEWDGRWYSRRSEPLKHGLLQDNFYKFYFEEIK